MTEYVILVDENDKAFGIGEKMFVHEQAITHRAFSVFIYRKQNDGVEILLQQRHPEKYHCGNLWTNTCCGHPRPNEEVDAAAARRLFEEMGLNYSLQRIGKFHYVAKFSNGLTEDEVDHVFIAKDDGQQITPHVKEIANYCWISLNKLKQDMAQESENFTPWLAQALQIAEPYFK